MSVEAPETESPDQGGAQQLLACVSSCTRATFRCCAHHVTGRNAVWVLTEFVKALTSGVFLCCVMTPFAAWAGVLTWTHPRSPELAIRALADGPRGVMHVWIVLLPWLGGLFAPGRRYRQMLAVVLALITLHVLHAQLAS